MNSTIAFLLGGLLLLVWVGILLGFKEFCLDKIKSGVGKYSLGMMFAYGILLLLYVASEHYLSLKTLLLNWYIGRIPGGIILILVPACYSIFLIGKGYFKEGGEKASFKWKVKMMVQGGSFSELVALIQEAALSINWGGMLAFVACCGLIVLIVWLDHKKHSSKSKHKG